MLLDTNILLRLASKTDALFPVVNQAVTIIQDRGEALVMVPQNLCEFWAAATRPVKANGLGLSISETVAQIRFFKAVFRWKPDRSSLFDEWESLVVAYACHGRVSYDARLVAAMNTHGITQIMTLNPKDFGRFPHITIIDPQTLTP